MKCDSAENNGDEIFDPKQDQKKGFVSEKRTFLNNSENEDRLW